MHPPVSPEKREALRQLRERLPPIYPRLAAASGLHVTTIREIASKEGWEPQHFPPKCRLDVVRRDELVVKQDEWNARIAAAEAAGEVLDLPPGDLASLAVGEMRAILAGARAGRIDKARADALNSIIRAAERIENLPWHDTDNQKRSDDELAEILTRVDRRIVELARDYAERLVGERDDGAAG